MIDNLIKKELILQHLNKLSVAFYSMHIYNELPSTNTFLLENLDLFQNKTLITCEKQTAGRGRLERKWLSNPDDITMSLLHIYPVQTPIHLLPFVYAVAINRALKHHKIPNQLKWPNDIYHDGEKIAGILLESVFKNNQHHIVVGIGLDNIYKLSRNELIASIIRNIEDLTSEFELFNYDFSFVRREWLDNCIHWRKAIKILDLDQEILIIDGIHSDLDMNGGLVVMDNEITQTITNSYYSLRFEF